MTSRKELVQFGKEDAQSFGEFWPYYLQMHSARLTRFFHIGGTVVGTLVAVLVVCKLWNSMLLLSLPVAFVAALLSTYLFAIPSHTVFEKNKAATLHAFKKSRKQGTRELLWSIRGDLQMTLLFFLFQLEKEIDRIGIARDHQH